MYGEGDLKAIEIYADTGEIGRMQGVHDGFPTLD